MSIIIPGTHTAESLTPAQVSATTVIEVWLERLDEAEGEDFGWKRVADAIVWPTSRRVRKVRTSSARSKLRAQKLAADRKFDVLLQSNLVDQVFVLKPIWDGDVTLPNEPGPDNRCRLVIAEYEEYLVDDDRPYDKVPTKKERRLVFIEHVELV